MAEEKLTRGEKATLLGTVDGKHMDDFNEEFFNLIVETQPLAPDEIDDAIRRSISRFLKKIETDEETALLLSDDDPNSVLRGRLTVAWCHGYMVARRWKRSILKNPNTARRKG